MPATNDCGQDCDAPLVDACDPLWPILEAFRECLCRELGVTVKGATCRCCVVHGDVAHDNCCESCEGCGGQAWVRLVSAGPSESFPQVQRTAIGCGPNQWAAEIELGVVRCACHMDDMGMPPSCCCLEQDAAAALSDRQAMLRVALKCDFLPWADCGDRALGPYGTVGPRGGCVGGTVRVTVAFDNPLQDLVEVTE